VLKKTFWANFQRIIELFTQKIVTKLSKIWIWDPGSGKNLFRIPDPGVKKAPDPGSGSATLHPALKNRNFIIFSILWVIFALLGLVPDLDSGSRYGSTDLIESVRERLV
jgi:hypothetical protein